MLRLRRLEPTWRPLTRMIIAGAFSVATLGTLACADQGDRGTRDAGSGRCAECHMPDYLDAPSHAGSNPTTCAVCHTSERWSPDVMRHRWRLTGAHERARCLACHVGTPPVFEGTGDQCVDCHLDAFARNTFPDHLRYSKRCEQCHTSERWMPATWNGRSIDAAEHAARINGQAWVAPSQQQRTPVSEPLQPDVPPTPPPRVPTTTLSPQIDTTAGASWERELRQPERSLLP